MMIRLNLPRSGLLEHMDRIYKEILNQCVGFDWDEGNINKNWLKHKVSLAECEQTFFNRPLVIQDDILHSKIEKRFYALGRTNSNRNLFIAFTIRAKDRKFYKLNEIACLSAHLLRCIKGRIR